jgi:predicted DNA-binding transcriptional regulator YafY
MDTSKVIEIDYTNWRGERAWRRIMPERLEFANSEWHPEAQWLLLAWDCDKNAEREFALTGIHRVRRQLPSQDMQADNEERALWSEARKEIATLTKERDEARAALKPFAAFSDSLREWRAPGEWGSDQKAWPKNQPVVQRSYWASADALTTLSLYRSDFVRAAKAMETSNGQ